MTAIARLPARDVSETRTPRAREDAPHREFGEELAQECAPAAATVPTAEQLALAGCLQIAVPQPAPEVPEVDAAPIEVGRLEQQAITKLALVAPSDIIDPVATDDEPAATPLEQAVLDLLDRRDPGTEVVASKPELGRDLGAPKVVMPAPVAELREVRTPDAPTSHVNLVLDEGEQRIVVTVAVRGTDVSVQLRGGDDIAAGLARNAATLDEAMRLRGLSLAQFSASRDPDSHDRERPHQERREITHEAFTLDEAP